MSLTSIELELCQSRPTQINYSTIESLQFLGNYTRKLPVSMARMMENALDWEHLPHVHSSSFAGIELIDKGSWGWRARTALPGIDSGFQLIDLLIDVKNNYWATTVFDGPGTGIQIHTRATTIDDGKIEIEVRFFSENFIDRDNADFAYKLLRDQYAILYDEDVDLMSGRQTALNRLLSKSERTPQATEVLVDNADALTQLGKTLIETPQGRFCVRRWNNQWLVHSATCPHLLGPLQDSSIDEHGVIVCPWHGYTFSAIDGENIEGGCQALPDAPDIVEKDGDVFLVFKSE